MRYSRKSWLIVAAVSASLVTVAGCNNSDSGDDFERIINLFIANDAGNNTGIINKFHFNTRNGLGDPQKSINMNLAEGIAKDIGGNFYQAGNASDSAGTIRTVCQPSVRGNNVVSTDGRDRTVTGALNSPKGIAIAQKAGLVIAAESGANDNAVSVFGSAAANAAAPVFVIPRSAVGNSGAWDIAYDEGSDKLFIALTNGKIAYYGDYLSRSANNDTLPTAIFEPANALAASNMHGIVYVADADRLIVSDVAVPGSADDGSIYVFEMASTLDGAVTPNRTIRGPATHLGNPVDLQLDNGDLIVAEKANEGGRIMVYQNIAEGASGDIAPTSDFKVSAPESILVQSVMHDFADDVSDLSGVTVSNLHVTSNAGSMGQEVFVVDGQLGSMGSSFKPVNDNQFVESISLDQNGDAFISFDNNADPSAGGLSIVGRLAQRSNTSSPFSTQRDRQISGSNTTLVSPKGVEVIGSEGLVLVADLNTGAPGAIKAYSLCGEGNNAPVFQTTLPGNTRPWDMDYDPNADRLFVAATNGNIQVYDNYISSSPTSPTRIINPDDRSGFADSNIHGIVHDSVNNRLIVSDVGSAGNPNDGRIYVIDNADTADGLTTLKLELAGSATALGNPVDLAFDGQNLFVAEKSNNQLQRIDDIYSLNGLLNLAPTKMMSFTAPESIAISNQ